MAGLLILKVVGSVLANSADYVPPNFSADFLRGREGYFWGGYHWAFYVHIVAGPITLLLGLFLVVARSWRWHRRLGWVQVALVLGLVTPSGLAMAAQTPAGPVGAAGLAALAVATAACTAIGVVAALRRRWADHRRWMVRSYLLLGSAVILRLIGGVATVAGVSAPWFDPLAIWVSWTLPLAVFEAGERIGWPGRLARGGRTHAADPDR